LLRLSCAKDSPVNGTSASLPRLIRDSRAVWGAIKLTNGSCFSIGSQQWQINYDYTHDTASPTTIQPLDGIEPRRHL
jgi:hypothetical protein